MKILYQSLCHTAAPLLAIVAVGTALASPRHPTAPAPAQKPTYRITDLGLCLDVDISTSPQVRLNNRGQVVGVEPGSDRRPRVWMWTQGHKRYLPLTAEGGYTVTGFNDRGEVGGNRQFAAGQDEMRSQPWFFDGKRVQTPKIGHDASTVLGLNAHSDMVGHAFVNGRQQAFVYRGGKTTLLFEDALSSQATAINARGQVVGTQYLDTTVHPSAALWENGVTTFVDASPARDSSEATAINAQGRFVGWRSSPRTAPAHAFSQWHGALTDLGTLSPGLSSRAYGISETGAIVGEAEVSTPRGAASVPHAFVWKGKMTDLNRLIPARSGWTLGCATGVNTRGQIVGYGRFKNRSHLFLLTPA